jgi:hypothetical protein
VNADLDLLSQRYLAGTIDAEGMTRLNAILAVDADARRRFAEQMNLDSALATQATGWRTEQTSPLPSPPAVRWRFPRSFRPPRSGATARWRRAGGL